MRDCKFSSAGPGFGLQKAGKGLGVLIEEVGDSDDSKRMPRFGQARGCRQWTRRGVGAGHADAEDVLSAKRVVGNGGDQGGVDAATEGDEDLAEAAFAYVVAGAKDKSPIGRFGVVFGADRGGAVRDREDEVFAKGFGLRDEVALSVDAIEEPSKMRLSLPPTWLHMITGSGHAERSRRASGGVLRVCRARKETKTG